MIVIYFIYTIWVSILVSLLSLFFVITCWWILFIPPYKRFEIFDLVVIRCWTFFFNNLIMLIRIKVSGKQYIDKKRTTLYICNHQSWVDIPVVLRYTHALGVSKKEVLKLPILGILIFYSGAILFDRDNQSSRLGIVKELIDVFRKKHSITLFPEGTRSLDGKLLEPNVAAIRLCYKLNVPVVAAALEGTRDILPRKRIYFKFFKKVLLRFNPPIYPKNYKNDEEFTKACWDTVKNTHQQIIAENFINQKNN